MAGISTAADQLQPSLVAESPASPVRLKHDVAFFGDKSLQRSEEQRDGPSRKLLTLVKEAADGGSLEPIETLLQSALAEDVNVVADECLWVAIQEKHVDLARLLLKGRACPNIRDMTGITPLHRVTFEGHEQFIDLLLEWNADVNACDKQEQTPLFFAPTHKVCDQLLAAKCNVNATNNKGQTALHLVCSVGLLDSAAWLLETMEPDLLELKDHHGKSAAYYAAKANMPSLAKTLRNRAGLGSELTSVSGANSQLAQATSQSHEDARDQAAAVVSALSNSVVQRLLVFDAAVAQQIVATAIGGAARRHSQMLEEQGLGPTAETRAAYAAVAQSGASV